MLSSARIIGLRPPKFLLLCPPIFCGGDNFRGPLVPKTVFQARGEVAKMQAHKYVWNVKNAV